jgi:hypothetical protein
MKQAIGNDVSSGSSPGWWHAARYEVLDEIREAEFLFRAPADKELRQLEERWMQWQKQRALIEADSRREHLSRVEAVKIEIDAARQQQLTDDAEEKQRAYFAADATETQKFVDALCAHSQAKWRNQAEARLARATKSLNADLVKAERKHFAERGLLRGTRR